MTDAFLDCYILVAEGFKYKEENGLHIYWPKKIFHYNSLKDRTFEYQNNNLSFAFEIQLPIFVIKKLTENIADKFYNGEICLSLAYDPSDASWSLYKTWKA